MADIYLGVDCGQTHLEAVAVDEDGRVLTRGVGGPSHVQGADMEAVFESSFTTAFAELNLSELPKACVKAVGLGVTGLGIPGKREAIERVIGKLCPKARVVMDHDSITAFWGASGGHDAGVVLAGTGSVAYGRNRGQALHLGGFGYLCGDEGSGGWIGLRAIRRCLHAAEGRVEPSLLPDAIAAKFGVPHVRQVPGIIYASSAVDVERIASLTRVVAALAQAGDALAISILRDAGEALGQLSLDLLRGLQVSRTEPFKLYPLGGVWQAGETLVAACTSRVADEYPQVEWCEPLSNAAVGAAWMAQAVV